MSDTLQIIRKVSIVDRWDAKRAGVPVNELHPDQPTRLGQALVDNVWMVHPLNAEWAAAYRFVVHGRDLVPAEMRIYPREPGWDEGEWSGTVAGYRAAVPAGGLTAAIARQGADFGDRMLERHDIIKWMAVGEIKMARAAGLHRNDLFGEDGLWGELGIRDVPRRTKTPHRRIAAHVRYARRAAVYVAAIQSGDTAPLRTVARRFRITRAAARDIIKQARANDLLLPKRPRAGRAEGELTAYARELLEIR